MHPILVDRYEILGQITRSRHSVIMLAIDSKSEDERRVAIKKFILPLPTEELAKHFEIDLSMARSLKNKYLVPYYDLLFEKQWGAYFAVMPYYKSRSLREQIAYRKTIRKPFEEASVWILLASMADLFTSLYSTDGDNPPYLCNRAICPDNIFVSQYGIIQLHRFQLGKYERFKTNKQKLTPCYHAPEVIGDRNWSVKSDIWSIACIAYEMCTLRPLYELLNPDDLFKLVKDTRPSFNLRGYSSNIQNLLSAMLDPISISRASPEYLLKHPTLQQYKEMLVCAGNGVCSCGGDGNKCCDLQMEYLYSSFVHSNYADAMEALSYCAIDYSDRRQMHICLTNKESDNQSRNPRPVEPISSSKSQLAIQGTATDVQIHAEKDYSITDFTLPHSCIDDLKKNGACYEHKDVRDFSPFDRHQQTGTTTSNVSNKQNDLNAKSLSTKVSSDNLVQTKKASLDTQGLSMSSKPHMSIDSLIYTGQKPFYYSKDPVATGSAHYEIDRQHSRQQSQKSGSPPVTELSLIQSTHPNNGTK